MYDLVVKKINHAQIRIECDNGIAYEIGEEFSFFVPNYKFMPSYRSGMWDGKIRIFNMRDKIFPFGLYSQLREFAKKRNYEIENVESAQYGNVDSKNDITKRQLADFIQSISVRVNGKPAQIRDYQFDAINKGLSNKTALMLSPTGSGKSLIQYVMIRYLVDVLKRKILLIVPTTSLVEQMYSDFKDYGWDVENQCHRIYSGKEKDTGVPVTITTWQSIYKLPKKWFSKYTAIFGDESHLFKAQSLSSIMNKSTECDYRIGMSGTLDGSLVHELVLQGHFGKLYQVTKTKSLQEKNVLANININVLNLSYPTEIRKAFVRTEYAKEIDFIVTNSTRNRFIKNLAKRLNGNTLLLFQFVEKQGRPLYDLIKNSVDNDRKVFFVYGGVDTEIRERIRSIVETQTNAIIVASYGVFSTGINIRNLHNIILASPSKSQIRVLQSIGRGLRVSDNKQPLQLYDICDNMTYKKYMNFAMKHSIERCKIYNREEFPWKSHTIDLNK